MQLYRWTNIVFWDKSDLEELHRIENRWCTVKVTGKFGETIRNYEAANIHWNGGRFIERMKLKYQLIPFWDVSMKDEEKEARNLEWKDNLSQITKGMYWDRECNAPYDLDHHDNVDMLHKIDVHIHSYGARPNRLGSRSIEEMRRQAARSEKQSGMRAKYETVMEND